MDLFSRKIVGWAGGPTIHRELVLNALLMAVRRRRAKISGCVNEDWAT
jgi:putative transposase